MIFYTKSPRWASEYFFITFSLHRGNNVFFLPLRHALEDGGLIVRDEITIECHGVACEVWGDGGAGLIGARREGEAHDGGDGAALYIETIIYVAITIGRHALS